MISAFDRPIVLNIEHPTMSGEARRAAMVLAGRLGFDETLQGKAALLTTEAATNLCKHARHGELIIQGLTWGAIAGIEILALDRGPGMDDVARCRVDGYSTAASPGTGLGAMSRLATTFDIHSLPATGTAVLARLWGKRLPDTPGTSKLEFGALSVPLAGEEVCGDSWAIDDSAAGPVVMVVDGLGHGPHAAEAAREAVHTFGVTSSQPPAEIIRATHDALKATRGAAIAVARIDAERGKVEYAGVGNTSGVIIDPADKCARISMVSHNGTAGHTIRKIQEFVYPWNPGSVLVMHSDGLASHWDLGSYAGLVSAHLGLIAGVLYRDLKRGRDDVTVVVAGEGGESR